MAEAFFLAVLVVAFLAGVVALAMPCCFTVLLPAYLAKSFDTTTGRLTMTAVFGVGIATVFLPIAVGVSFVAAFIATNHSLLFVIGGSFMVILGLLVFYGISVFPHANVGVDLKRNDLPAVYALGVFGGVASSCCAPVLAGVLILAALTATWPSALAIGVAYVAGMVFPLFLVAAAWKRGSEHRAGFLRGRMVRLRLFHHETEIHSSKLIAGGLFLTIGVATIALGAFDQMAVNPGAAFFGIYESGLDQWFATAFSNSLLTAALALVTVLTGAWFVLRTRRRRVVRMELGSTDSSSDGADPKS